LQDNPPGTAMAVSAQSVAQIELFAM